MGLGYWYMRQELNRREFFLSLAESEAVIYYFIERSFG